MNFRCRPMQPSDFEVADRVHWESTAQVAGFIERQGIASMLAFEGDRCVGQLYLNAYDPAFREPGGWTGDRPWADFGIAQPLSLKGRFLTLGCYHVGRVPTGSPDPALQGRGIATALLEATIEWVGRHDPIEGLLAWGLVAGSRPLLDWAGQLPHTFYRKFGFRETQCLRDPRLEHELTGVDTRGAEEDPATLRVMFRRREV